MPTFFGPDTVTPNVSGIGSKLRPLRALRMTLPRHTQVQWHHGKLPF